MSREYKPREIVPSTAVRLEVLLRDLQLDIESRGSEATKQRRRLLLRGVRVGAWSLLDKPKLSEVAQVLRAELFGHTVELVAEDDDIRCHPGTDSEV
jgi:hypothetical protein